MLSSARALVAATTIGAALGAALLPASAGAADSTAPGEKPSVAPVARVYVSLPGHDRGALIDRGLRAALRERGATAGGRRIRIVRLDDSLGGRWDADRVVADAQRAAADPTAIAYVGEGSSEATALSMPILNRAGLVQLAPAATATDLTSPERAGELEPTGVPTFFRPIPSDRLHAAELVSHLQRTGITDGVLLVDDGGHAGRGLTSAFVDQAAAGGVRVTGQAVAGKDRARLDALAQRVEAESPRAIVYGGTTSGGAVAAIRALHAASPRTLIFSGEALAHDAVAKQLGAAQSVVRLTVPAAHIDPRTPGHHGLGTRPAVLSVFAHNGMTALLRAIDRSARTGAVTRQSVRTAVFDGTVQSGLSGAWGITASGDSSYGVFDALHLSGGQVRTPGEIAVASLVRKQSAALRKRLRKTTQVTDPTAVLLKAQAVPGVPGSFPTSTIGSMDLESMMMQIQSHRSALLEEQLKAQMADVQARNDQLARLRTVLTRLGAIRDVFPAGSDGDRLIIATGAAPAVVENLRSALAAAVTDAGLSQTFDTRSLGTVRTAIAFVEGLVESQSNSQQMDMLRLQSLSNKRNEAFDLMTNFVKKMQDSRASIIGSMRL